MRKLIFTVKKGKKFCHRGMNSNTTHNYKGHMKEKKNKTNVYKATIISEQRDM